MIWEDAYVPEGIEEGKRFIEERKLTFAEFVRGDGFDGGMSGALHHYLLYSIVLVCSRPWQREDPADTVLGSRGTPRDQGF